jgi:hypothetical protein
VSSFSVPEPVIPTHGVYPGTNPTPSTAWYRQESVSGDRSQSSCRIKQLWGPEPACSPARQPCMWGGCGSGRGGVQKPGDQRRRMSRGISMLIVRIALRLYDQTKVWSPGLNRGIEMRLPWRDSARGNSHPEWRPRLRWACIIAVRGTWAIPSWITSWNLQFLGPIPLPIAVDCYHWLQLIKEAEEIRLQKHFSELALQMYWKLPDYVSKAWSHCTRRISCSSLQQTCRKSSWKLRSWFIESVLASPHAMGNCKLASTSFNLDLSHSFLTVIAWNLLFPAIVSNYEFQKSSFVLLPGLRGWTRSGPRRGD